MRATCRRSRTPSWTSATLAWTSSSSAARSTPRRWPVAANGSTPAGPISLGRVRTGRCRPKTCSCWAPTRLPRRPIVHRAAPRSTSTSPARQRMRARWRPRSARPSTRSIASVPFSAVSAADARWRWRAPATVGPTRRSPSDAWPRAGRSASITTTISGSTCTASWRSRSIPAPSSAGWSRCVRLLSVANCSSMAPHRPTPACRGCRTASRTTSRRSRRATRVHASSSSRATCSCSRPAGACTASAASKGRAHGSRWAGSSPSTRHASACISGAEVPHHPPKESDLKTIRAAIACTLIAAVCAGAQAAGPKAKSKYDGVEIKVLSDRSSDGLMQPLFDAFERDTGIEVEAVFLDEGLVARLESRPTQADLVITKDAELIEVAKRKGLLAKLESPVIEKTVPAEFRDQDGEYFVDAYRARGIIVSKDRVKPGAIQNYEDLAKPEWRGKVCTRSGKHTYNIAVFDQMMKAWGDDKAKQVVSGIAANLARPPEGDDREQAKAIMEGVCDVALLNSYYYPRMFEHRSQIRWGQATRYVFPDQAGGGTFVMRSAVALTKATKHRDAARMFAEYIAGEKAQRLMVERTKQYSVLPSVPPHASMVKMGAEQGLKNGRFKVNHVSLEDMADKRQEALQFVEQIKYDSGPSQ